MADTKSTKAARVHPLRYPDVFKATELYQRPLELWPHEFRHFEELAGAVEELATLDRRGGEGILDNNLKLISNQLFDLVEIMQERYEGQDPHTADVSGPVDVAGKK